MAGLVDATKVTLARKQAAFGAGEDVAVEVDGRAHWGLMCVGLDLEPDEVVQVADKITRLMFQQAIGFAARVNDDLSEITISGSDLAMLLRSAWVDGLELGEVHARQVNGS